MLFSKIFFLQPVVKKVQNLAHFHEIIMYLQNQIAKIAHFKKSAEKKNWDKLQKTEIFSGFCRINYENMQRI